MEQNLNLFDFILSEEDLESIRKLDMRYSVIMPKHHEPEIAKMFMRFVSR